MTTLTVTATPCLHGELSPSMANTQRFNAHLNIGRQEAIVAAVDGAMFAARAVRVDFNDPSNTIVLRFGRAEQC